MKQPTFGIIGAGIMGTALCESLIHKKTVSSAQIFICDRDKKRARDFAKQYKIRASDAQTIASSCDYILLAVKPQDFEILSAQIQLYIRKKSIALSIMAGVTIKKMQQDLRHKRVVRAMPNLAARVGQAMTVYKIGFPASAKEKEIIDSVFSSFGKSESVQDENLLDAATAISGSGPGYVYLFMECLVNEAKKLGFTSAQAQKIIQQTFEGAIAVLRESGKSPEVLRSQVASKRGTTEAAVRSFKKDGFGRIISHAVRAAYQRSKELSR